MEEPDVAQLRIKALLERVTQLEKKCGELEDENATLRHQIDSLEEELSER